MRKKDGKPSIVPGLILIFIGIVAVLNNFEAINLDWEVLWTYFILLLGLIFWLGFIFDRTKDGLIMPGTILLTYGIILNLHMRFGNMDILWPFFILGPAFGFYAMYLLGKRDRGLLIPAVILTIIGSIFLLQSYSYIRYVWPLVLVVLGVLLLLRNNRDDGGDTGKQE